jgi:phosphatidylserine/phosphatidylglycerophosphate/cardiolipin synthase-like enzyme
MQIGDTRFVHLVSDQQVIKQQERKTRTESEEPVDTSASGVEDGKTGLMEPGKMLALVRQKNFNLGDVQDSVEELRNAKGFKASEKELREISRELKVIHGDLKGQPASEEALKRGEWVNLAQAGVKASLDEMTRTRRGIQWDKMTGGMETKPSSIYETYFKETNVPVAEMREVLQLTNELHQPGSPLKIGGNDVKPLMRGDIWAAKMNLLDRAIENPVQNGKPVEIDAEYYEMTSPEVIGRLRKAAEGGARVRVLLDPGHLASAGKDGFDATSLAVRASTVSTLMQGMEDRDMAVTLFPNKDKLGGRDEIMHRKIFRVGETVVFGGMNANTGSGENVDFAMSIDGPATRRFGEIFKDDIEASKGSNLQQIYGSQMDLLRNDERPVTLSRFGFESLLSSMVGKEAGVTGEESREERTARLINAAKKAGISPYSLGDFEDLDKDGRISSVDVQSFLLGKGKETVALSESGRKALADVVESTVAMTGGDRNVEALGRVDPPEGKLKEGAKGSDVLSVGNSSVERQALVLDAIGSAERFIKISAFVLNDDMAKLLIEKKKEKEGKGESFDIQVVMDPGMYGYGGSPNEPAYKRLEDAGINVKWSLLDRTNPEHDRKNHSKLIITDQMILTGSTNFSEKGLRKNWEVNDVSYFVEGDPDSEKKLAAVTGQYDRMWEREAIGISTRAAAERRLAGYTGDDGAVRLDKERSRIIRDSLRTIESFEKEMGARIQKEGSRRDLHDAVARRVADGENEGYALLNSFSDSQIDAMRRSVPSWNRLMELQRG